MMTKQCKGCGKTISEGVNYCPFCGKKVETKENDKKGKNRQPIILPIMGLIVGLILFIGAIYISTNDLYYYVFLSPSRNTIATDDDNQSTVTMTEDKWNGTFNISIPSVKINNVSFSDSCGIVTPDSIANREYWEDYKYDPDYIKRTLCTGDVYVKAISSLTKTRFTLICSQDWACEEFVSKNGRMLEAVVSKFCRNFLGKSSEDVKYEKEFINRKNYLMVLLQDTDIPNYPYSTFVKAYITHKNGYEYIFVIEQDGNATTLGDKKITEGVLNSLEILN